MWVKWNDTAASNQTIFELTGTTRIIIGRSSSGIRYYNNGTEKGYSVTVPVGAWNHIAIVRNSGTTNIYLNGVSGTSFADTTNWAETSFYTSRNSDGQELSSAFYMSNLRVVSGTAVYTANFAPPVAPLTAISGTTLLLCQSNKFIDNSTNAVGLTKLGNPIVSSANPFQATSGNSLYFDGTGDYLKTVSTPLASLQGDFTIECWLYWTTHGNYGGIVSCANSNIASAPTSGWAFVFYSTTDKLYFETGTGFSLQTTNTIPSSQWNHVAVVRSGSTITHYLNGVANGSGTSSSAFNVLTTDNFVIGIDRGLSNTLTGYIADPRITKSARYTANFTPPTSTFLTK